MNKPLVVVWSLVYNHEPYLRDCFDGLVMQKTNFRFVAIVHEDCSTDNSAAIIREYAEKYPDIIKPIYETENQYSKQDGSLDRIMNEAIDATGAKYVAMCEGDDYWTDPYKLQKQVDMLENNNKVSICINRVQAVSRTKEKLDWMMPQQNVLEEGLFSFGDFCRLEFGGLQWVFHYCGFMTRASCFSKWPTNSIMTMFPYGDMPVLLYCLLKGNGYYMQDVMSCYRVDSGGYNSSIAANLSKNIQHERQLATALRALDEDTQYRCHKYIQQRIWLCEYREYTLGDNHHWRIILPQYWRCIPGNTARMKILNGINIIYPPLRIQLKQIKSFITHRCKRR